MNSKDKPSNDREEKPKAIDFDAIRKRNAEAASKPLPQKAPLSITPTWTARVTHLIEHHLSDLTDWEEDFVYSTKTFLISNKDSEYRLTAKVKGKIIELEDAHCGQMCHALNEAGIPHS